MLRVGSIKIINDSIKEKKIQAATGELHNFIDNLVIGFKSSYSVRYSIYL